MIACEHEVDHTYCDRAAHLAARETGAECPLIVCLLCGLVTPAGEPGDVCPSCGADTDEPVELAICPACGADNTDPSPYPVAL